MSLLAFYLVVYGLLACAGGLMGFLKAKSKASLVAGSLSGALLGVAAALVLSGRTSAGGGLAIFVAVALLGRFGPAFAKTRKMMPAGLMVVLSAIAVVLSGWTLLG